MSRKTVTLLDVTVSRVPEGVPPRSLRIWPAGAAPLPNLPESRRYPFWKAEKCIHFFRSTCSLLPPPDLRHFGSQTQCCSCSQMACTVDCSSTKQSSKCRSVISNSPKKSWLAALKGAGEADYTGCGARRKAHIFKASLRMPFQR